MNAVISLSSLTDKLKELESVTNSLLSYIDNASIHNKNVKVYIVKLEKILSNISQLYKDITKIEANDFTFETIYKHSLLTFCLYNNTTIDICKCINELTKGKMRLDTIDNFTSSDNIKDVITKELDNIMVKNRTINTKYEKDISIIISTLSSTIVSYLSKETHKFSISLEKLEPILDFMEKIYLNCRMSIQIYAKVLQIILNKLQRLPDRTKLYMLIGKIEDYKNNAFDIEFPNPPKYKQVHIKNPINKRFDLKPMSSPMTLDNALSRVFRKMITNGNIEKLSATNKTCIIILTGMSPVTYEYTIDTLIDTRSYVGSNFSNAAVISSSYREHGSIDPASSYGPSSSVAVENNGVDVKMVKKFTCIKHIADNKKWEFSVEIHGMGYKDVCILDCVADPIKAVTKSKPDSTKIKSKANSKDNKLYTIVSPWDSYTTNLVYASNLLEYCNNNNTTDRITKYNTVVINKAKSNMFISKPMSMDIMENQSNKIDTGPIQNNMYTAILKIITDDIRKLKTITGKKILKILKNEKIIEAIEGELLNRYNYGLEIVSMNYVKDSKFQPYEIYSTFYYHIHSLCGKFMKYLYDDFIITPIADALNDTNKMINIVEDIILANVQNMFNGQNDVMNLIYFKYLLLNYV